MAGQSFSGHEVKKRVTGCDQDLDIHVELEVVDEEGLRVCKPTRKFNNAVVPHCLWDNESWNPHHPMDTKLQECSSPLYNMVPALHRFRLPLYFGST